MAERYSYTVNLTRSLPLSPGHPMLADPIQRCAACHALLKAGDRIALIPVGPGKDEEMRKACREGKLATAISVAAHWACATGEVVS